MIRENLIKGIIEGVETLEETSNNKSTFMAGLISFLGDLVKKDLIDSYGVTTDHTKVFTVTVFKDGTILLDNIYEYEKEL